MCAVDNHLCARLLELFIQIWSNRRCFDNSVDFISISRNLYLWYAYNINFICKLKLICVCNLIKHKNQSQQTVYGICDCLICFGFLRFHFIFYLYYRLCEWVSSFLHLWDNFTAERKVIKIVQIVTICSYCKCNHQFESNPIFNSIDWILEQNEASGHLSALISSISKVTIKVEQNSQNAALWEITKITGWIGESTQRSRYCTGARR